jgi:hypothetical protein
MARPDDQPMLCPVCDTVYASVSVHDDGLVVNLLDNERYRRVCFDPVAGSDGEPLVRFFHHTHEQVDSDAESVADGSDAPAAARRGAGAVRRD